MEKPSTKFIPQTYPFPTKFSTNMARNAIVPSTMHFLAYKAEIIEGVALIDLPT